MMLELYFQDFELYFQGSCHLDAPVTFLGPYKAPTINIEDTLLKLFLSKSFAFSSEFLLV